jgi:hypothetical protein
MDRAIKRQEIDLVVFDQEKRTRDWAFEGGTDWVNRAYPIPSFSATD